MPEGLALMLLARDGIAAIWQLNEDAAVAHRTGHPLAAASIVIFTPLAAHDVSAPKLVTVPALDARWMAPEHQGTSSKQQAGRDDC